MAIKLPAFIRPKTFGVPYHGLVRPNVVGGKVIGELLLDPAPTDPSAETVIVYENMEQAETNNGSCNTFVKSGHTFTKDQQLLTLEQEQGYDLRDYLIIAGGSNNQHIGQRLLPPTNFPSYYFMHQTESGTGQLYRLQFQYSISTNATSISVEKIDHGSLSGLNTNLPTFITSSTFTMIDVEDKNVELASAGAPEDGIFMFARNDVFTQGKPFGVRPDTVVTCNSTGTHLFIHIYGSFLISGNNIPTSIPVDYSSSSDPANAANNLAMIVEMTAITEDSSDPNAPIQVTLSKVEDATTLIKIFSTTSSTSSTSEPNELPPVNSLPPGTTHVEKFSTIDSDSSSTFKILLFKWFVDDVPTDIILDSSANFQFHNELLEIFRVVFGGYAREDFTFTVVRNINDSCQTSSGSVVSTTSVNSVLTSVQQGENPAVGTSSGTVTDINGSFESLAIIPRGIIATNPTAVVLRTGYERDGAINPDLQTAMDNAGITSPPNSAFGSAPTWSQGVLTPTGIDLEGTSGMITEIGQFHRIATEPRSVKRALCTYRLTHNNREPRTELELVDLSADPGQVFIDLPDIGINNDPETGEPDPTLTNDKIFQLV